MLETHTLTTDSGTSFAVRIARPTSGGGGPGLVMVHEWYGLTSETERMAQQFADAGFVVSAVDLYDGTTAKDDTEAMQRMMALDSRESATRVAAAARQLAALPEVTGKIGVLGFCMGGAVTFVAACHVPEAAAFAPFYGIPHPSRVDFSTKPHGPIEAHFAKVDAWATPEKAQAIVDAVHATGGEATLHTYDGGHAFMRATDPSAYHAPSAALAFARCTAFFAEQLRR